MCISNSSWSDAFSLDTVGSYGCVQCPANNMDYLVTAPIPTHCWFSNLNELSLYRITTLALAVALLVVVSNNDC